MKKHRLKMIAPVMITILSILYFVVYFGVIIACIESILFKVMLGIVPLVLSITMVGLCIQRMHEIKSGEEDDLDLY